MIHRRPKQFSLPDYHHSIFYEIGIIQKYIAAGWIALPVRAGTRHQVDILPEKKGILERHSRWDSLLTSRHAEDLLGLFDKRCTVWGVVLRLSSKSFAQFAIHDLVALDGKILHEMSFQERRDRFPVLTTSERVTIIKPLVCPIEIGKAIAQKTTCGLQLIAPYEPGFRFRVWVHPQAEAK